jgi:hypothetical protein
MLLGLQQNYSNNSAAAELEAIGGWQVQLKQFEHSPSGFD